MKQRKIETVTDSDELKESILNNDLWDLIAHIKWGDAIFLVFEREIGQ